MAGVGVFTGTAYIIWLAGRGHRIRVAGDIRPVMPWEYYAGATQWIRTHAHTERSHNKVWRIALYRGHCLTHSAVASETSDPTNHVRNRAKSGGEGRQGLPVHLAIQRKVPGMGTSVLQPVNRSAEGQSINRRTRRLTVTQQR